MSASGKLRGNNPVEDHLDSVKEMVGLINDNLRNQSDAETESDLGPLWDSFIQAAFIIPADDAAQDRLVRQLRHVGNGGMLLSEATKKGDVLSSRYPLLAKNILDATLTATNDIKKDDTLNLAAFTAKLMGELELNHEELEDVKIKDDHLLICALVVLRATLETKRRLNVKEEGTETPVADLLPAAVAWFEFAGWKLVDYAFKTPTGCDKQDEETDMLVAVGDLAFPGTRVPELGISLERWYFWGERLGQLSSSDDEEIKEQALKGREAMRKAWGERSDIWED